MRVNVYAEELTGRVELVRKNIGGEEFTAIRFCLALPATMVPTSEGLREATVADGGPGAPLMQFRGRFIHKPGDDDSSAVTFWGKKDLRPMLREALRLLDEHERAGMMFARKREE